jgi:hypothetical protein
LIHCHRQGLKSSHGAKSINDYSGQSIAFTPEDTAHQRINTKGIPILLCTLNPSLKKIRI